MACEFSFIPLTSQHVFCIVQEQVKEILMLLVFSTSFIIQMTSVGRSRKTGSVAVPHCWPNHKTQDVTEHVICMNGHHPQQTSAGIPLLRPKFRSVTFPKNSEQHH